MYHLEYAKSFGFQARKHEQEIQLLPIKPKY